ncbi:MAG: FAD-binding oxidoreductase, partial [Cytophagaceae bacterium]
MGLNEFLREIPKGIHIVDAGIYAANTLGIEQRPPAALQVADRAAISSLVRIASAHSVRLNAVSTGKNWGYGSALSADREAIIVDLSLLKSVNFNVSDETVTLEPGVTQGQLFAYLRDSNLPFMAPTTGAGPNVSIMGNALERGYGVTPIEDHWSAVVRLEAVLADGSIYRPAMQELTGSCHWHWDIGPYMQGLFAQSALGIVTEITLRLYPRPETTGFFYAKSADLGQLIRFAKSMRKLEFVKGVNIMNGLRVAGIAQDSRPKPYWTLVGTFYTPTIFVRVLKAFIRTAASREKLRVTTIDQTLFRRFRWLLRRMSKQMHKLVGEFFKAVDGEPTTINLNLVRGEHN